MRFEIQRLEERIAPSHAGGQTQVGTGIGNGNGPPGTAGALQISRDAGRSWRQAPLAPPPNSTIWCFATHAGDPDLLFCASINGYVYRSEEFEHQHAPDHYGSLNLTFRASF